MLNNLKQLTCLNIHSPQLVVSGTIWLVLLVRLFLAGYTEAVVFTFYVTIVLLLFYIQQFWILLLPAELLAIWLDYCELFFLIL